MDVINQIVQIINEGSSGLQDIAAALVILAFVVGGILQITGGNRGAEKARPWYIGGVIGFIIVVGANAFVSYLQTKITF